MHESKCVKLRRRTISTEVHFGGYDGRGRRIAMQRCEASIGDDPPLCSRLPPSH